MPEPMRGESKAAFVSRCVRVVSQEEPDSKMSYRVAKCYGIWRQAKKEEKKS